MQSGECWLQNNCVCFCSNTLEVRLGQGPLCAANSETLPVFLGQIFQCTSVFVHSLPNWVDGGLMLGGLIKADWLSHNLFRLCVAVVMDNRTVPCLGPPVAGAGADWSDRDSSSSEISSMSTTPATAVSLLNSSWIKDRCHKDQCSFVHFQQRKLIAQL